MLLVLLSLSYLHLPVVTADSSADSSFIFSSGWRRSSDNSLFTNTLGHALTFTIPESTIGLNYVGLKRTGGSLYGVCVDCASDTTTNLQLFSGHDSTLLDNADAEPATIFSLNVDPNQTHIIQVTNVGDSSFGRESELTFVSIDVVQDVSSISSSTTSSSTTSSSTSSSSTTIVSSSSDLSTSETAMPTSTSEVSSGDSASSTASATPSVSASPASASFSNQTKSSLIAAIVIPTVIAVLSLVIGIFFYVRKQRRSGARFVDFTEIEDPPTMQTAVVPPSPSSSGFLAMAGRKKPITRLPEPYPYDFPVPQDGPIAPVRRFDIE